MYPAVPISPTEVTERADKADRVCSPNKRAVERIPIVTSSVLSWKIQHSIAKRDTAFGIAWIDGRVGQGEDGCIRGKGRKTR